MVRGLYRTHDPLLGETVRVHWSGGDAAPILSLEVYAALAGSPPVEALPTRAEYEGRTSWFTPDLLEDRRP